MGTKYETTLITSASSGIGRAMALWWVKRDTKVYAAARQTQLLDELAAKSKLIEPVQLDVSDGDDVAARVQKLDDACGGLDLVVANASVKNPTPARTST